MRVLLIILLLTCFNSFIHSQEVKEKIDKHRFEVGITSSYNFDELLLNAGVEGSIRVSKDISAHIGAASLFISHYELYTGIEYQFRGSRSLRPVVGAEYAMVFLHPDIEELKEVQSFLRFPLGVEYDLGKRLLLRATIAPAIRLGRLKPDNISAKSKSQTLIHNFRLGLRYKF